MSNPYPKELDNTAYPELKNKVIQTFINQRLNGLYEEYNSDGLLIKQCYYKDNVLDGPYMTKTFTKTVTGNKLNKVVKLFYVNGVISGPYEAYTDNNLNIRCTYQNSKLNGLYREINNNVAVDKYYVDNSENGVRRIDTPTYCETVDVVNGVLTGIMDVNMKNSALKHFSLLYSNNVTVVSAVDTSGRDLRLLPEYNQYVWQIGVDASGLPTTIKLFVDYITPRTVLIPYYDYHRVAAVTVVGITDHSGNSISSCTSYVNKTQSVTFTVGSVVSGYGYDSNIFNNNTQGIYVYKYLNMVKAIN